MGTTNHTSRLTHARKTFVDTALAHMAADSRARRLEAAASANDLLAETGVDQARQIDVFELCERLGLWLAFFPLDRLLGAFIPEGVGGVLITTQRPVTVQRYTAAHELGHWRLGHAEGPALDSEEHVLGTSPNESEQLAQIFAAALLMPPPLVFGTLDRLGVRNDVSPVHAYTVAREAGVSYEAAVRQLANLGIIAPGRVAELMKTKPLRIKTEIAYGRRPVIGTADVWPVDEHWDGHRLVVRVDDEVVISLPENRSKGYRWVFEGQATARYRAPEPPPLHGVRSKVGRDSLPGQDSFMERIKSGESHPGIRPPRSAVALAPVAEPVVMTPNVELDSGATVVGDRYLTARVPELFDSDPRRARLASLEVAPGDRSPNLPSVTPPVVGATGCRVLGVRFQRPGSVTLRLSHQSPYNDSSPLEEYVLNGGSRASPTRLLSRAANEGAGGGGLGQPVSRSARTVTPPRTSDRERSRRVSFAARRAASLVRLPVYLRQQAVEGAHPQCAATTARLTIPSLPHPPLGDHSSVISGARGFGKANGYEVSPKDTTSHTPIFVQRHKLSCYV